MKNTMKLAGIIALVALIGFGMAACDNGTTGSKFEGTWKNAWDNLDTGTPESIEYTFTDSDFVGKTVYAGETFTMSGTFTFTDTTITFTRIETNESWTQEYTLTATTLYLVRDPGGHWNGEFLKQ